MERYPFDWKTPVGYIGCILIQALSFLCAAEAFIAVLVFIIGFCYFMTDFANDFRQNFLELNEYLMKANDNLIAIDSNEIMKRLTDLIQFHSDAKE